MSNSGAGKQQSISDLRARFEQQNLSQSNTGGSGSKPKSKPPAKPARPSPWSTSTANSTSTNTGNHNTSYSSRNNNTNTSSQSSSPSLHRSPSLEEPEGPPPTPPPRKNRPKANAGSSSLSDRMQAFQTKAQDNGNSNTDTQASSSPNGGGRSYSHSVASGPPKKALPSPKKKTPLARSVSNNDADLADTAMRVPERPVPTPQDSFSSKKHNTGASGASHNQSSSSTNRSLVGALNRKLATRGGGGGQDTQDGDMTNIDLGEDDTGDGDDDDQDTSSGGGAGGSRFAALKARAKEKGQSMGHRLAELKQKRNQEEGAHGSNDGQDHQHPNDAADGTDEHDGVQQQQQQQHQQGDMGLHTDPSADAEEDQDMNSSGGASRFAALKARAKEKGQSMGHRLAELKQKRREEGGDGGGGDDDSGNNGNQGDAMYFANDDYVNQRSRLFGIPLEDAAILTDPYQGVLPSVVRQCISYIQEHGITEEGIFRLSGDNAQIQEYRRRYDAGDAIDFDQEKPDVNVTAGLLKLYFRELPSKLLPDAVTRDYIYEELDYDSEEGLNAMRYVTRLLPPPNYAVAQWLFSMLSYIEAEHKVNKMKVSNLAIVFCPTLRMESQLFKNLVLHYGDVFE